MTACAAELQSQPIWLPTTGVNNRDRRQLEERSDAGERRGNRWTGWGLWIDFISSIRVTHPPTITLPDTKSLFKSFSPILNPYALGCSLLQRGLEEVIESGVTGVSVRAWMRVKEKEKEKGGSRWWQCSSAVFPTMVARITTSEKVGPDYHYKDV